MLIDDVRELVEGEDTVTVEFTRQSTGREDELSGEVETITDRSARIRGRDGELYAVTKHGPFEGGLSEGLRVVHDLNPGGKVHLDQMSMSGEEVTVRVESA